MGFIPARNPPRLLQQAGINPATTLFRGLRKFHLSVYLRANLIASVFFCSQSQPGWRIKQKDLFGIIGKPAIIAIATFELGTHHFFKCLVPHSQTYDAIGSTVLLAVQLTFNIAINGGQADFNVFQPKSEKNVGRFKSSWLVAESDNSK